MEDSEQTSRPFALDKMENHRHLVELQSQIGEIACLRWLAWGGYEEMLQQIVVASFSSGQCRVLNLDGLILIAAEQGARERNLNTALPATAIRERNTQQKNLL